MNGLTLATSEGILRLCLLRFRLSSHVRDLYVNGLTLAALESVLFWLNWLGIEHNFDGFSLTEMVSWRWFLGTT